MTVSRTRTVQINNRHFLYGYCKTVTSLANNLSNAARFRQRQMYTMARKDTYEYTENEIEILNEFRAVYGKTFTPPRGFISYSMIEEVMRFHNNPDFFAKGLPRQTAQHVIRSIADDAENYIKALLVWNAEPGKFTGKPELPGYKKKHGMCTAIITNQDCTITEGEDGNMYAGLPFAKKLPLNIGFIDGKLQQVTITPCNNAFTIGLTFNVQKEGPSKAGQEDSAAPNKRIAAIDFGVGNIMAVTNNCGLPCLLYKGGIIKSINQYYNKNLARIMEEEMSKPDCPKNKKGEPRFVPTEESMSITLHRNNAIKDRMFKLACSLVHWCVENRIDTLVAGANKYWKQNVNMGRKNNQKFVGIPYAALQSILQYKCGEHGIQYVEQEESYTSKASFLDMDYIPAYGIDDDKAHFSGTRGIPSYKGRIAKNKFRGLYKAADGTIINSDLNGSANILRKAFPDAFMPGHGSMVAFNNVVIITDPDHEFIIANRMGQPKPKTCILSKTKARRLLKKLAA